MAHPYRHLLEEKMHEVKAVVLPFAEQENPHEVIETALEVIQGVHELQEFVRPAGPFRFRRPSVSTISQ